MLASIDWPHDYLPGTTDNFCSNEVIVKDLPIPAVWDALVHPLLWPGYYANSSDIELPPGARDGALSMGCVFRFKTFGFPIDAEIIQLVEPAEGRAGRVSWHGWAEGDKEHRLDVVHAWLIEELPENRTRILTQESQIGKPARELAKQTAKSHDQRSPGVAGRHSAICEKTAVSPRDELPALLRPSTARFLCFSTLCLSRVRTSQEAQDDQESAVYSDEPRRTGQYRQAHGLLSFRGDASLERGLQVL